MYAYVSAAFILAISVCTCKSAGRLSEYFPSNLISLAGVQRTHYFARIRGKREQIEIEKSGEGLEDARCIA